MSLGCMWVIPLSRRSLYSIIMVVTMMLAFHMIKFMFPWVQVTVEDLGGHWVACKAWIKSSTDIKTHAEVWHRYLCREAFLALPHWKIYPNL